MKKLILLIAYMVSYDGMSLKIPAEEFNQHYV
jgi:hypothetical protein